MPRLLIKVVTVSSKSLSIITNIMVILALVIVRDQPTKGLINPPEHPLAKSLCITGG